MWEIKCSPKTSGTNTQLHQTFTEKSENKVNILTKYYSNINSYFGHQHPHCGLSTEKVQLNFQKYTYFSISVKT